MSMKVVSGYINSVNIMNIIQRAYEVIANATKKKCDPSDLDNFNIHEVISQNHILAVLFDCPKTTDSVPDGSSCMCIPFYVTKAKLSDCQTTSFELDNYSGIAGPKYRFEIKKLMK